MHTLSLELINEAYDYLQPQILKTPCEYSPELSQVLGVPVYFKCEFLQLTGSFKVRGALFRMSKLTPEEKAAGVVTCSAGNHGKAVAYVGSRLGISSKIYVPNNIDETKLKGIQYYGGDVVRSPFTGFDETQHLAKSEAERMGRVFITPFDDERIMAANGGSLAVEILQDILDAKVFLFPASGGGLAAGLSYYVKEKVADAQVIGCQHVDSPGLKLSLERSCAVTELPPIDTIAGGIEGGVGKRCFHYLQSRIDNVALVSEEEIKAAVRWMLDSHQYVIEPSAAAPIAAILSGKVVPQQGPVVLVLTGRNVSLQTLKMILA